MWKMLGKLLIALVAVLALFAGGFWITGGGDGRVRQRMELTIARPAVEVFPWLVEPEHLQQWLGGLQEMTPLTEGGPRVGAKSREVIMDSGKRRVFETTIIEFGPPWILGVRIQGDTFVADVHYELREHRGKTLLQYRGDTHFQGFFYKLMEPIVDLVLGRKVNRDLQTLRTLVESAQPTPTPEGNPPTDDAGTAP